MKIEDLENIIKKANYSCNVEKESNKEVSAPASTYEHRDLFGQPIKKKAEEKPEEGKEEEADEADSDNPKGLPERPTNSNKEGDSADTDKIDVPAQSNDAVTGTGEGSEY